MPRRDSKCIDESYCTSDKSAGFTVARGTDENYKRTLSTKHCGGRSLLFFFLKNRESKEAIKNTRMYICMDEKKLSPESATLVDWVSIVQIIRVVHLFSIGTATGIFRASLLLTSSPSSLFFFSSLSRDISNSNWSSFCGVSRCVRSFSLLARSLQFGHVTFDNDSRRNFCGGDIF